MRSVFLLTLTLVFGGTSVTAQQAAKSPEVSIMLPPSLARVLTDYERNWKAGDASALAQLFTDDGFVLSLPLPLGEGRGEGLRESLQSCFRRRLQPAV